MEQWRTQTNLLNAVFGIILFISPWLLGFATEAAGWNAWLSGALLTGVSIACIAAFAEWEEWIDLAIGLWIIASPWALHYPAGAPGTKVHLMVGIIVSVLAAVELWKEHHAPHVSA